MQTLPDPRHLPPGLVLRPDEKIRWTGQPFQGFFALRGLDAYLIPFSIMWAGFAVFWNVAVWTSDAPIFFRVWGLPFLVAGAYFTVGRFVHNKMIRSKMSYLLTDTRAIVMFDNGKRINEHALSAIKSLDTSVDSNGRGTIKFAGDKMNIWAAAASPKASLDLWRGPGTDGASFYRIDEVRRVISMLQDVLYNRKGT